MTEIRDNLHRGKRAFIIGGGPSVNRHDKDLLKKLDSEIVIGANKAYKIVNPTYTVIGDKWFYNTYTEEIELLEHPVIMPNSIKFRQIPDHYIILTKKSEIDRNLPTSFKDPFSFRNNTGCAALRVAYLLGCNPIYLVGIDCQLDNMRSHWHEYYPEDRRPGVKRLNDFYDLWKALLEKMIERREIYSCSITSELNRILEWADLKKVLDKCQID